MKRILVLTIAAMTVLTGCGEIQKIKDGVQIETEEKTKYFHPTWIGGKWYYLYY